MPKIFLICSLFFVSAALVVRVQAQNLVTNSSFEDYDSCMQTYSPYGYPFIKNWVRANIKSNPGYFNFCSNNPNFRPIGNTLGSQLPKTGNAFSSIFVYTLDLNIVEGTCSNFLQGMLNKPLQKDSFYCVNYYVSQADYFKLAIDRFGAFFSNTQIISPSDCFPYSASVETPKGYFFNDTANWMLCQMIYRAKGGEQYITIGNFNSFASTNSILSGTPTGEFYDSISSYYIDDVSVEPLPASIASLNIGSDSTLCDTAGFTTTLSVPVFYDSVKWNTGESTFSINVSKMGVYSVTAYYGECAVKDTVSFSIFDNGFQFTPIADTTVCASATPIRLSVANGFDTYSWSNGDKNNFTDISTSGTYSVMATNRCFTFMDTFNVTVLPTPAPPIVKDTTLCEGTPDIPVTAVGSNLKWYGNNSDTSLLAEPPLIKTNATTQQHFFVSQTINGCESNKVVLTASVTSKPEINLGNDKVACEGKSLSLSTQNKPNEHYLWNTGDTSSSIVVNINGTYSCMATNVCGSNEDAISVQFVDCDNCLYVPNVFSPNDDGNNDFFQIYSNCPIINFRIKIFNSWGEKIFESERKDFKWDGNYKGYLQDAGIYTYILSLTNELGQTLFSKGSITLVR